MRIHSLEKIEKLKELRKKGYSINELVKELSIPKTTIWHHIQSIRLGPPAILVLKSKIGGSALRKQKNWENSRELAKALLSSKERELVLTLTMLYWAEGSKRELVFTNSDGRMIDLFIKLMVNVFKIDRERIVPTMRIFTGMNEKECLNYWVNITGVPEDRFFIRLNDGGFKSKSKYGVCRLTIKKGANTLKLIHSLINQYYNESSKLY